MMTIRMRDITAYIPNSILTDELNESISIGNWPQPACSTSLPLLGSRNQLLAAHLVSGESRPCYIFLEKSSWIRLVWNKSPCLSFESTFDRVLPDTRGLSRIYLIDNPRCLERAEAPRGREAQHTSRTRDLNHAVLLQFLPTTDCDYLSRILG